MPERSEGNRGGRVDINQAARETLKAVPGIGASLADRIVAGRPYAAVSDLRRVAGIGASTFDRLEPFLTVANIPTINADERREVRRAKLALLDEATTGGQWREDAVSPEHMGAPEQRQVVDHEVPGGPQSVPDEVEGTQEEVVPPRDARNGGAT